MSDKTQSVNNRTTSAPSKGEIDVVANESRLMYETPTLIYYGDVRDVTLGPTVGIGESGNELGRRPPS